VNDSFANIPAELRERRQWVLWRREEREGKPTKVPYRATAPRLKAKATDPATWGTFEQALSRVNEADGIGYVFAPDDPFCGVDFDEINPTVLEVVGTLGSYTERSVSGTGLHIIVRGRLNGQGNRKGKFEVYDQARYFVMTGDHLEGTPATIEERQAELDRVVAKFLPAKTEPAAPAPCKPLDLSDQELIEKAFAARNGEKFRRLWEGDTSGHGDDDSAADQALCNLLAFWTGNDPARMDALFRRSLLMREKWHREDYRTRTIENAITQTREVYEGPQRDPAQPRTLSDVAELSDAGQLNTPDRTIGLDGKSVPDPSPFIDWGTFWDRDRNEAEWVYPDVLARGRGHALYAGHKQGKSLVMLWIAAELAIGSAAVTVLYLDFEMTENDLFDRLEDMGHGPQTDLSRLFYALLPTLPPLDTPAGAAALMELVDHVQTDWPEHHLVVVVDTIGRAVCGAEDLSDTWRAFYAHSGIELKRRGCTWVRLDHGGKDLNRGQRGSSGKGDDVDVVWKLARTDNGVALSRDVARMNWVPEKVTFTLSENPLTFRRVSGDWPLGTMETAARLDALGVALEASTRTAQTTLKEAGEGRRREVVIAALRWRRECLETAGTTPGTTLSR
jgi:hypothetical protein